MENPRSSLSQKEPDRERTVIISGSIEQEEDIAEQVRRYAAAGCDIITAPTVFPGEEDKIAELISLVKANSAGKKTAGVLSAFEFQLEPFGDLTFDALVELYAKQADALFKAGVDLFFIRGAYSVAQARAAVLACRSYKLPIYLTVFITEKGKLLSGASARCALIALQSLGIAAFGITAAPKIICEELSAIRELSRLPVIGELTAGDTNPILSDLYELSPLAAGKLSREILECGVAFLSAGEGITWEHIKELSAVAQAYVPSSKEPPQMFENDIFLANETDFFVLDNDRLELSEHVHCELDMADTLLASEQNAADVINVIVQTIEEAGLFADNAHFTSLPVCFTSDNPLALERALFLYHGKALLDSRSPIEDGILKTIAAKYGAIVY